MIVMAGKPTSVTLSDDTKERLDAIARTYDRSRSWLITNAVKEFLEREEVHVRAVREGIAAAERGELVPHDEVMSEMDQLIEALSDKATVSE